MTSTLLTLREASCHVGNCLWEEKGTEAPKPTTHRELDPANDVTECGGGSSQAEPSDETAVQVNTLIAASEIMKQRNKISCASVPEIINLYC